ncbi:MAG: hypothetical protein AB9891_01805 [Anaerolineaceae bacterium]
MNKPNPASAPAQNTQKRTIVILIILAGVILVVFFGLRTFRTIMRIRHMEMRPLSTDVELIRGWMTIPYISENYRVPPEMLVEACDLPPAPKKHENLDQINRKIAPGEPGTLVECIKGAVSNFQQSHPTLPAKSN